MLCLRINSRDIVDKSYYYWLLLGLCIVALFVMTLIYFLLPEAALYNDSSYAVISNNTDLKIINHSFNYVSNVSKDTPSFIMRHRSSPHYSPILNAINFPLDWSRAAETSVELNRPITSGTDISRNDSVMGTVYNAIKNVPQHNIKSMSSGTSFPFTPFTPSTYEELNREISNMASNLQFIEETCNTPERRHSLIEKIMDHSLYLLNQKYSHLDAIQKLAADTPISQRDYDDLVKSHRSLSNDINELAKKLDSLKERSLFDTK